MKTLLLSSLLLFNTTHLLLSQNIIGTINNGLKSDLISINETTAVTTLIATLDSLPFWSSNSHTVNQQSGKLIMWSSNFSETGNRLYTIDLQTGATNITDNIPEQLWGIEYANSSNTVIGLIDNGIKSDLVSIDETTGVTTLIATLDSLPSYPSNTHALHQESGKLLLWTSNFSETANRLYNIDILTGAVSITDNITEQLWGLEYHNSSNTLIGLIDNGLKSDLVSIDETTGITTFIATLDSLPSYASNTHTLNQETGKLLIRTSNFTETTDRIYTIDIQTGAMIINDNITLGLWGLEYHNPHPSSLIEEVKTATVNMFPNPSTNFITLTTHPNFSGTVSITDLSGKEHLNRKVTGNTITLNIETLGVNGTYFVKVTDKDNNILATKKLLYIATTTIE